MIVPRTKQISTEQASKEPSKAEPQKREQTGIAITIETSRNLYAQIENAARQCGYTPEEWVLFEAIMDKI